MGLPLKGGIIARSFKKTNNDSIAPTIFLCVLVYSNINIQKTSKIWIHHQHLLMQFWCSLLSQHLAYNSFHNFCDFASTIIITFINLSKFKFHYLANIGACTNLHIPTFGYQHHLQNINFHFVIDIMVCNHYNP